MAAFRHLVNVACALLLVSACSSSPATTSPDSAITPDAAPPVDASRPPDAAPPPEPGHAMVATYHRAATEAGLEILRAGGNAFDAFIAATVVQYVLAPGSTSLAGHLGALIYDAQTGSTAYLDADFNSPQDPAGLWTTGAEPGRKVPIPGAVAGLEALSKKHGELPFARVLQPAIAVAEEGFEVSAYYAAIVKYYAPLLQSSEYGQQTFFSGGAPIRQGATLKQPAVAAFLRSLAEHGADHMYRGPWAEAFVSAVNARGGKLTASDLASYEAAWVEPWKMSYRGSEIHASAGLAFGGLWDLVALKALEQVELSALPHPSRSADALEVLVRVARGVWDEGWLTRPDQLRDRGSVESKLSVAYGQQLWQRVQAGLSAEARAALGEHSYQLAVVDEQGNAITGIHSIQSLPWGEGVFVEGVPLSTGGQLPYHVEPGGRRLSPLALHLVFEKGQLRAALGTYGSSLIEAELQLLVNLIDYGQNAEEIAGSPRFGTFPLDRATLTSDPSKNWLDPSVDEAIVDTLAGRGLQFDREATADTGLGTVIVVADDGTLQGATAPFSYAPGSVAGY